MKSSPIISGVGSENSGRLTFTKYLSSANKEKHLTFGDIIVGLLNNSRLRYCHRLLKDSE